MLIPSGSEAAVSECPRQRPLDPFNGKAREAVRSFQKENAVGPFVVLAVFLDVEPGWQLQRIADKPFLPFFPKPADFDGR